MVRVFAFGNFGVHVFCETGSPHHLPHAHVKQGGNNVATVFLLSIESSFGLDKLPRGLVDKIKSEQPALLAKWEELNGDD